MASRLAALLLAAASACTASTVLPDDATVEGLAATCRTDRLACTRAFESLGITLPRGTSDVPLSSGLELRLSPNSLTVGRTAVLPLAAGRPAPGAFVDGISPALTDAITPRIGDAARVLVLADRRIPMSTLRDALFTADRAGAVELALLVDDGRELHGQPISPPSEWQPLPPGTKVERALKVLFSVHIDAVELRIADGSPHAFPRPERCAPPPAGCHDLAAIAARVAELKAFYPNEVVAIFRGDADLPLQALISVIDAVRGPQCRLAPALRGEKVPDDCLFWQAIIDVAPPLLHPVTPQ
jgi:biopolymer transport protein ExbD